MHDDAKRASCFACIVAPRLNTTYQQPIYSVQQQGNESSIEWLRFNSVQQKVEEAIRQLESYREKSLFYLKKVGIFNNAFIQLLNIDKPTMKEKIQKVDEELKKYQLTPRETKVKFL
ncbi:unnamed protein product [Dicrocoelium dendriticum]|nr:unnamed protein product [Dicrocoelium dendriticum]